MGVCVFFGGGGGVFLLFCVGTGLAAGRCTVQGAPPHVYKQTDKPGKLEVLPHWSVVTSNMRGKHLSVFFVHWHIKCRFIFIFRYGFKLVMLIGRTNRRKGMEYWRLHLSFFFFEYLLSCFALRHLNRLTSAIHLSSTFFKHLPHSYSRFVNFERMANFPETEFGFCNCDTVWVFCEAGTELLYVRI